MSRDNGERRFRLPQTETQTRPIPEAAVLRLLGDEPAERIHQRGLRAAAVRTILPRPSGQLDVPPTPHKAVICRLYPNTDLARLMFRRGEALFAEAIVFPDPDDDLELNLLEGFHNAVLAADRVLAPDDNASPIE